LCFSFVKAISFAIILKYRWIFNGIIVIYHYDQTQLCVIIYCYHTRCMLPRARKETKGENGVRQYLYPSKKFCSGPSRPSCKTCLDCITNHTSY
jgi:hypothetical protein